MTEPSGFAAGEARWAARLGNLRNAVRQEVIARQLADHVRPPMAVLDVGCGQGTQALRLAARGCAVTGIDASADLLDRCATSARATGVDLELLQGRFEDLDDLLGDRRFDAVCAHGLLMYLPLRPAAIASLAARVREGGFLSITFRNGDALAYRPGLRGDWQGALDAFDAVDYVNELGVHARADRLDDVTADVERTGLDQVAWYGVRVLTDHVAGDVLPPADPVALAALLDAEDQAGRRDPYRHLGSQLHVVARRPPT